jgi:hypothetical protein
MGVVALPTLVIIYQIEYKHRRIQPLESIISYKVNLDVTLLWGPHLQVDESSHVVLSHYSFSFSPSRLFLGLKLATELSLEKVKKQKPRPSFPPRLPSSAPFEKPNPTRHVEAEC